MGLLLLTGAGGVLGRGLACGLPDGVGVALLGRQRPPFWPRFASFVRVDLAPAGRLAAAITQLRPRAILHAAGPTRLAVAEADPAAAQRLGPQATAELLDAARSCGARVVLVSTDMVFAGTAESYGEDDAPDADSVYGRAKAACERLVLDAGGTVARLPLLLGGAAGPARRGADADLLAELAAGRRPCLFRDELRSPVAAELAATGLYRLLLGPPAAGVFHLVGGEAVDRHTLGLAVCRAAGVAPDFDGALAAEIAPGRPRRLVLRCERARAELGWPAPALRESLARRFPPAP